MPETATAGRDLRAALDSNRAADIAAHERLRVPPAPVTFSQGPVSALGQMLSRVPFIGGPIRRSLDTSLVGARDAATRISEAMAPRWQRGAGWSYPTAGLERFRNAGIEDLEPGILTELGIQPRAPGLMLERCSLYCRIPRTQ